MSYSQYELLKAEWKRKHPFATPEQYQQAMMKLARKAGI
jgi:hypothetical protein